MCRIERSYIDHPDGTRETRDVVLNCPRGTRNRPCSNVEIVPVFDDFAAPHNANIPAGPHYQEAAPREFERPHSRQRSRQRNRERPKGLSLTWKIFNPFSSKKPKDKYYLVKNRRPPPEQQAPAVTPYLPRAPMPPPPPPPRRPVRMPSRGRTPNIVRIKPKQKRRSPSPQRQERQPRQRRRRDQPVIVVRQSSSSSEDDSPPLRAARVHQPKSRSMSPRSKSEVEKKYIKEKERRQYAEKVAREEERARKRAAQLAEYERSEKERVQERLEYEEKRRIESAERTRRRQQQEDYEIAQAKRRQELEDIEILNARQRAERRREEADRRRREEHERHRLDEEERLERARRANIPRRPRHPTAVHQPRESMEDRGERFIREAIRQENLRRFERDFSPDDRRPRRAYDDYDGLRRRNIDDGRRPRYDGWRERRDRRSD